MNVLVLGATGFIGGVVAEYLRARGHQVVGLARSSQGAQKLRSIGYEVALGDLADPASLRGAVVQADAIVQAGTDFTSEVAFEQSTIGVAKMLMATCSGTDKVCIFTSGSNVYGGFGDEVVDESIVPERGPMLDYESYVLSGAAIGIRAIVIRPPLVYGRSGGPMSMLNILRRAKMDGVSYYLGSGDLKFSAIHVDDLAELYVKALERAPAGSVFNAATKPITLREFAVAISHAIGLNGEIQSLPFEAESLKQWPTTRLFLRRQHLDASKALRELQWSAQKPSVLEELIGGTYDEAVSKL